MDTYVIQMDTRFRYQEAEVWCQREHWAKFGGDVGEK